MRDQTSGDLEMPARTASTLKHVHKTLARRTRRETQGLMIRVLPGCRERDSGISSRPPALLPARDVCRSQLHLRDDSM